MKPLRPIACILLAAALPVAGARADGAFGVTRSTRISSLPTCTPMIDRGWYHCRSLPVTDDRFEFYWVQSVEPVGVCVITALGAIKRNDADGAQVRRDFDTIRRALTALHGAADQYDVLMPDSPLTGPPDWMNGLAANQRLFSAEWDDVGRDGVDGIDLRVKGLSSSTGRVELEFHLSGYRKCEPGP